MRTLCLFASICAVLGAAEARVDGHKVWYEVTGKGSPALVLVHGWTCDSSLFTPQMPGLSKSHRVLAIDLPGHGKSDKPEITYDGKLFAQAVLAAMDAAKIDRAVLVGHSMGLPVIRTVYAEAPSRVVGLVSIDGAVFSGSLAEAGKSIASGGIEARTKMINGMFVESTSQSVRDQVLKSMLAPPQYVAISAMENGVPSTLWSGPPATVPILAINRKMPNRPEREKLIRAAFTNIEYHEMDGVGHFLQMEKPDEVNRMILEWVKGK